MSGVGPAVGRTAGRHVAIVDRTAGTDCELVSRSQLHPAMARPPDFPEATFVGLLSAQLSRPRSRSATAGLRRFETSPETSQMRKSRTFMRECPAGLSFCES